MSYIITARASLSTDVNSNARIADVDARVLSRDDNYVTFDIPGIFGREQELAMKLCKAMVDAGFVAFEIGHSY